MNAPASALTTLTLFCLMTLSQVGCGESSSQEVDAPAASPIEAESGWRGELPLGFPTPTVPLDKQMSPERVELGRHLFYDPRLSLDGEVSCASCHQQRYAFADGEARSRGATGELTPRNAMSLTNAVYNSVFTWANPNLDLLEEQIVIPLFGERPVEMGLTGREDEVLRLFMTDPTYQRLFALAYPQSSEPASLSALVDALGAFTRALVSGNSPFDRYVYHQEPEALSAAALRGMNLFFSERLECHHCHGGFNFSFSTSHINSAQPEVAFHNTGLYNLDGQGAYPMNSLGIFEVTGDPNDMGRFRAPTLRNIAVTAPYMHDGSMETLEEVIRFYEVGGRHITEGPLAGDGRAHPLKSEFVSGFTLTDEERADVISFLESLTDERFLTDTRLADPWPPSEER